MHVGVIYVLILANEDFLASKPKHRYYIYESRDHGKSFTLRGELPGNTNGHAYGAMTVNDEGALICYKYDSTDEFHMPYHISYDMGLTWAESGKSYCTKRIRNPQIAKVKSGYLLHGRSGCLGKELPMHFVLYISKDELHWDEGEFICACEGMTAYDSNNLVLDHADGTQSVLIQASVPYSKGCVNISHWRLDIL